MNRLLSRNSAKEKNVVLEARFAKNEKNERNVDLESTRVDEQEAGYCQVLPTYMSVDEALKLWC